MLKVGDEAPDFEVSDHLGRKVALHDLPLHDMQAIEPRISKDVLAVLSADNSVKSRGSYGGTAPKNVRKEASRWPATPSATSACSSHTASGW